MKCCVGICLLFLASGLLMESGTASAGSLEAIGRDGVFVAYANGVVADAHGQGSANPLPNTRSTIQHYAPVENQGNPCMAASRR